MRRILLSILFIGLLGVPAGASDQARSGPAFHEEAGSIWEGLKQHLEEWGGRLREHFDYSSPQEARPLISFMLSNQDKLQLSSSQVQTLEKLRNDFRRQSIRLDADLKVAEMDLAQLLDSDSADMGKVESKVREIEKLKGDLRLARLRAIEEGKRILSQEQRVKLKELLGGSQPDRSHARARETTYRLAP
jgi:Spy/CpxP family protein refolding chaperone